MKETVSVSHSRNNAEIRVLPLKGQRKSKSQSAARAMFMNDHAKSKKKIIGRQVNALK